MSQASLFYKYDAGKVEATGTYQTVEPEARLAHLLIYPMKAGTVKLNNSTKEIYLPAETWTPISVSCTSFAVKVAEDGDVYWQGWYL